MLTRAVNAAAAPVGRLAHQAVALVLNRQIGAQGDRATARADDEVDDFTGGLRVRTEVDGHGRPGLGEPQRDAPADAARRPGDEGDLPVEKAAAVSAAVSAAVCAAVCAAKSVAVSVTVSVVRAAHGRLSAAIRAARSGWLAVSSAASPCSYPS